MNNTLLDLIQGADVEWTTLGEVAEISKGKQLNKDLLAETGRYPVINGGINPSGYWSEYNNDENTITVSQGGASAGFVNWMTVKFFAGAHCYVVKPDKNVVMNRYVYHFVKLNQSKFQEKQYGAGIPALSKAELSNLTIPIPSLEIQQKVVEILDKMTDYVTELTAELTLRQKQYSFYRDKLLTFPTDSQLSDSDESLSVRWTTLGEVLIRTKGTKITAGQMKELDTPDGTVKIFAGGKTIAFVKSDSIPEKDILTEPSIIVKSRGVIEFDYYDKPFSHKNELWSYHSENDQIDIKFVWYFLKTQETYFQRIASKMQMPQISTPDTENFKIPLPPLKLQSKIVEILDKFQSLTEDVSGLLPEEIKLRQKQYAYYREQLLTFNDNSAKASH